MKQALIRQLAGPVFAGE